MRYDNKEILHGLPWDMGKCSTRDENITRGEAECNIFIEGLAFFHIPWQTMQYFLYHTENPLTIGSDYSGNSHSLLINGVWGIPTQVYCIVERLIMNHVNHEEY